MMKSMLRASLAAACVLAVPLAATAAGKLQPVPVPIPTPKLPSHPLHSAIIVEVNKKGQVVRVKNGNLSHDSVFDTMTIGNALQMWIRHPDGTATAGLFRVTYDYDPHTHNVRRQVALLSAGCKCANEPGAATRMVQTAEQETREVYERLQAQAKRHEKESEKNLPDINAAVKRAVEKKPAPSPKP